MKPGTAYKLINRYSTVMKVLAFYLTFYVLSSLALYQFEHEFDKPKEKRKCRCDNLIDAFWMNTVFLLTGFEDFGPRTPQGKFISFLSFALGLATVTFVTGKIASILVIKAIKEKKMRKELSGHITICNWHEGGEKIIKEIHSPQAEPDVEIVILTRAEVHEEHLRYSPEFERVYFMRCDPTLHSGLKASRVSEARSVIILADQSAPDPDATTAMISLAITRLCPTSKRPHIVAEAVNHRKIEHLEDAGVDEIICASDFQYGIIAQCGMLGRYGKLSEVYQQLLTYTDNTNELYIIPPENIPPALFGKTFWDACLAFQKTRDTDNPLILIGLVRSGKVILNPRNNKLGSNQTEAAKICENDGLILIGYDQPNLNDKPVWSASV